MKETGNILAWLGMAEQKDILIDAEEHVEETCKTVAYLSDAVRALVGGDLSAKTIAIEKVRESERAADKVRSRMVDHLAKQLLLPPDREDLVRFVKALDKIADWTNSAARLLWFLEGRLPEAVLKHISGNTELIVSATARLREAIHAMRKNDVKQALEFCEEVERIEHEADDQKMHLIGAIVGARLEPAQLLLCYNLAESLEGITDKVETVADMIKLLVVKSR